MGKFRTVLLFGMLALLSACGGGHSGGSGSTAASTAASTSASASASTTTSSTTTSSAPTLANFTTITVDGGPAALATGANAYRADNSAFVSVTVCAPGSTTNCQTVDHVQVDTGSVGLRIVHAALNASLAAALPSEADVNANPVGECFGFVSGYAFGSVRQADVKIGGEAISAMPLQVIGDSGVYATVPSQCSAGAGTNLDTVSALGANGILGIGVSTTDCGAYCTQPGGYASAIYFSCPTSGCSQVITRAASTTAPFEQLPNPVAAMAVDNNGTIISLPAVSASGQSTATGTLYFGIGTQTNNALGSATVLKTTVTGDTYGPGLITATYNGVALPNSLVDSGTTVYLFSDSTIPKCTRSDLTSFYCPTAPTTLNLTMAGENGGSATVALALNSALTLSYVNGSVLPGLGASPSDANDYPSSFSFGLPFFYGRNVYTAIEGRTAGGVVGPYIAF
jgi:hypothetical protein